jgi:hypothetical protein
MEGGFPVRSTLALLLAALGLGGLSVQAAAAAAPPAANAPPAASAPTITGQIAPGPKHQAAPPAPKSGRVDNGANRRSYDVRSELALAQNELARGQRMAAEQRLDAAATYLLNSQAAERGRLGNGNATRYDKPVDEVLSAFKATRSGQIGTARTMVDEAIDSLKSAG